jgi:PAS domain S-box-containing protein
MVSLQSRFFWLMSVGLVLAIGGLFLLVRTFLLPQQLASVDERATLIGRLVQCAFPVMREADWQTYLETIQKQEPSVAYVAMLDKTGKAIAHSNPARVGMVFSDAVSIEAARDGHSARQFYIRDRNNPASPFHGEKVLDFNLPLTNRLGAHVGAVTVGVAMQRLEAENTFNWLLFSSLSLVLMLLYALFTMGHVREIRRGIRAVIMSERRFVQFVEQSNDGVALSDTTGKVVLWNSRMEQITGVGAAEAKGVGIEAIYWRLLPESRKTPELKALMLAKVREMLAQGGNVEPPKFLTREFRRATGETFFADETFFSVMDGQEVQGVAGIVRDVSEHLRLEAMLRESEQRYRALIDSISDLIMVVDAASTIKFVNSMAMSMLGYPQADFQGKRALDWVHPEDRAAAEAELARILEGKNEPIPKEMRIRHRNGNWIWVDIVGANHLSNPWLQGILLHVRNLTHHKAAEEQNALLEGQLRQAQKLEAIGTLAGGIAHDFNNILAAIISSAEMARGADLSEAELREYLDGILTASSRAKELIRQILAFSRQSKAEKQPIHLETVILESLKLLRSTLPTTLEMLTNVPDRLPPMQGNATQMQQILINLCTNAAHAMAGQSGRLEIQLDWQDLDEEFVKAKPELRPGRHLRLSVSDTGRGIDAVTLKRVFEPFFTTKQPGEGTGLGLSVVHGIVKDHQGAVSVYSQPGRGTTFRLYFRALDTEAAASERPPASLASPGHGERILVVEDEVLVASLMERMLKRLNYVPTVMNSPVLALATFRQSPERFDAVITDMTMPKLTGVQLAVGVRELRPGIPIVLCSGFTGDFSRETLRAAGIVEILSKPTTFAELSELLTRILPGAEPLKD